MTIETCYTIITMRFKKSFGFSTKSLHFAFYIAGLNHFWRSSHRIRKIEYWGKMLKNTFMKNLREIQALKVK